MINGLKSKRVNLNFSEDDSSDDDDNEEEDFGVIYNPLKIPLDFDGKPIPYWLYKFRGLNRYFKCQICGNREYRGRNLARFFTRLSLHGMLSG